MEILMAHMKARAKDGGLIHFAVFAAESKSGDNDGLLNHLTAKARADGMRIDQSALAIPKFKGMRFYGDEEVVKHLTHGRG